MSSVVFSPQNANKKTSSPFYFVIDFKNAKLYSNCYRKTDFPSFSPSTSRIQKRKIVVIRAKLVAKNCLPNKIKKSENGIAWRRQSKSKHNQRRSSTPPTVRPTLLLPPMVCTGENSESSTTTVPVITTRVQQNVSAIYHTADSGSQPKPSAPSPGHLFYNTEDHSDITFIVGLEEWRFPAHSFILGKSRPTLSALLRASGGHPPQDIDSRLNNTDMSSNQQPPIILKLPDLHPEVFEQILRYIYTGQVTLSTVDTTLRLLYPSQVYHLPLLTSHCLHHISKNVNTTNVLLVLSHLLCPEIFHPVITSSTQSPLNESLNEDCHDNDNERNELVFKCFLLVDHHADDILQSEHFETLEHELMVEIIKRDSLQVSSEAVVFDSVMRWACRACKKQRKELTAENKCSVLGKALFLVRYLTMTPEEFLRGPVSQGVLSKEDKEILLSRLTSDGSTTQTPLPDRWGGWKISTKRHTYHTLMPIASPNSELVNSSSDTAVSPSNSVQPPKSDRKKKSMSKKLLNGVGDLVICVIQLLD